MNHMTSGQGRDTRFGHAEAFCLMWYRDKVTGERERLWNSRDGVTPMFIGSTAGNEASHVDWHLDECRPNHVPKIGDRIFVDLTLERAREYRRVFVDKWWDVEIKGGGKMSDRVDLWTTKEEAVEYLARGDYHPPSPSFVDPKAAAAMEGSQPDVVVVDAEMLVALGNRTQTLRTVAPMLAELEQQLRAAANEAAKPRRMTEQETTMHPDLMDAIDVPRLNRKQRRGKRLRPGVCPHCNGSGKAP